MAGLFGWVRRHLLYVGGVLALLLLLQLGQLVMTVAVLCAKCKEKQGRSGGADNPLGDRSRLLGRNRRGVGCRSGTTSPTPMLPLAAAPLCRRRLFAVCFTSFHLLSTDV